MRHEGAYSLIPVNVALMAWLLVGLAMFATQAAIAIIASDRHTSSNPHSPAAT